MTMRNLGFGVASLALGWSATLACSADGGAPAGSGGSSATGGSGSGATGAVGAFGGFGASTGDGGFAECASSMQDGELKPLDMFIMLDKSGSMSQGNYWAPVTSALSQFVGLSDAAGIGVGLALFPTPPTVNPNLPATCASDADCGAYGPCMPIFNRCNSAVLGAVTDSCVSADYARPVVPIAELPGNASALQAALSQASPNGNSTPTSPALEGAIDYAAAWAAQHPDHVTIVVLATDGEPTGCNPNRVETAAARAEEGLLGAPSVKTFVIGIGNLSVLDQIAQKGGTERALIVSGASGQEFLDRMNEIRGAIGCEMPLPTAVGSSELDFNQINVTYTPEGAAEETLPRRGSAAECQGQPGWFYDNPAAPRSIQLCPSSCDRVEYTVGAIRVVLGCATIVE